MRAARGTDPGRSARLHGLSRISGIGAAGICLLLLAGLLIRSSPPVLPILVVLPLAWLAGRSRLAPAYLLVAAAPLQSIGLHHLSFSLVDALLLLFILKIAVSLARGAPPRDLLRWPRGPLGVALGAFLALTMTSGVVPAVRLARDFFETGWRLGTLSIAQAVFAGTMNPLGELWHHAAVAILIFHMGGRPLRAHEERGWSHTAAAAAASLGIVAIMERIVAAHWGLKAMVKVVGRSFTLGRMPGPFRWPTQFASYLDLILPTVLALAIVRPRMADGVGDAVNGGRSTRVDRRTVGFAFVSLLGIIGLYLALTRSGWVGLLLSSAAIIVLGFRAKERRRRLIVSAALLCLVLAPLTLELWKARTEMAKLPGAIQETGGRAEYVWPTAARMIRAHPILGCGLGMWRTASMEYAPYALRETRSERVHAHNILLQVASESGVPAALSLLFFLCLLAWRLWRRSRGGDPTSIGLAATLPGYVFHGMFENTLFPPELFLTFWVYAVLAMGEIEPSRVEPKPRNSGMGSEARAPIPASDTNP